MSQKRLVRKELRTCRLCLCDDKHLIYLFEACGIFTDVAKAIMEVLQYEVSKDDRFPPYICSACTDKLWQFKAFKEKCDNAKESFESFLSKTEESLRNHEEPLLESSIEVAALEDKAGFVMEFLEPMMQLGEETIALETEGASSPNVTGKLVSCTRKDDEEITENFQVFAESIVAVKSEDGGVDCQESSIDCYHKEFPSEVAEDNTGTSTETKRHESVFKKESPTRLMEKANARVFAETIVASNLEEGERVIGSEVTDCYDEMMQRKKWDYSLDACNSQSSNSMRHLHCARDGEEDDNLEYFQDSDEGVEQQEKGKRAMTSTRGKRDSECEDVERMASKEVEKDQSNIGENEVASQSEIKGKEIAEENKEGLSDLRISVVEWANEETCFFSVREYGIKCHHCGELRETKQEMAAHLRVVHGFGDEEDKDTSIELAINDCSKRDLGKHLRVYSGRKGHICNICDNRFMCSADLKRHERKHSKDKRYKCSICDCRFSQNGVLKKHMLIHSGEKPYKCTICDYSTCVSSNLKTHMRVHSGEKPYKCSICDHRCSESGNLKIHMRRHSGDKPYKCSVCESRFTDGSNLKRHMMKHTGEKPCKCSICGYGCYDNRYLREHMRIHSGDKPCKCSICDFSSSYSSNLKAHMRIHSGEKPYTCSICDHRFSHTGHLKRHMKTHNK